MITHYKFRLRNVEAAFVILMLLLFTACDPPLNIQLENKGESTAIFKFYLNSDSTHLENSLWDYNESSSDSIFYVVEQGAVEIVDLGIGNWSDYAINTFSQSLRILEIETDEQKVSYKTTEAIKKLLEENKRGLYWKTNIVLTVE